MATLQMLNAFAALAGAFALSWVVLNPRIHEGLLVKVGLMTMIMGLLVTFAHIAGRTDNWQALWASGLMLRAGILIVVVGVMYRKHHFGSWHRAFDWSTKWANSLRS